MLITMGVGWFIFTKPELSNETVGGLAISASLLTTPYAWRYEHALLILPWAWLFVTLPRRRVAQTVWLLLAWIVPWTLSTIAVIRFNDSFGFVSPLLTLTVIMYTQRRQASN